MKLSHIINPVLCDENNPSYLYYAQPITFKSMYLAKKEAEKINLQIELYSINFPEDDLIIPDYFIKLEHLKKSTQSEYLNISKNKKLPFIQDIINSLYKNSDADYFIYTNSNIGVQKNFYIEIYNYILNDNLDSFIINRRDNIPKFKDDKRLTENDLEIIYKEQGIIHRGYDCFIFKKELVQKINLGDLFIGYPPWGTCFYNILNKVSNNFKLLKSEYLTFHLGNDKIWNNKKDDLYNKNVENSKNIENNQNTDNIANTNNIENTDNIVNTDNIANTDNIQNMNNNIFICGCVKNCEPFLLNNLKNMVEIGILFNDYKIIIAFDNSTDKSLEILNNFIKTNDKLILLDNKEKLSKNRIINICNARNSILNKIRQLNIKNYKYFIMMDMDNRFHHKKIDIQLFKKYILNDLEWDSLSFHLPGYYDIWALSYDPYIYSCWHYFKKHALNKTYVDHVRNDIITKLNNLKDNELFDVYSAFCGFAIYKIEKFLNINYNYIFKENLKLIPKNIIENNIKNYFNTPIENINKLEDCEHRYFHMMAKLKNNAKIKICKYSLFI